MAGHFAPRRTRTASRLEQSARAFAKIIDQVNTVGLRDLRGGPVTNTSR